MSRAETAKQRILLCNDVENQFNHVMRDGLSLGDFEVINKRMWQLITATTPDPASQLIRSFERIGLGMRTQIEYFYQRVSPTNLVYLLQFETKFVCNDKEMLAFKQETSPDNTYIVYYSCLRPVDTLKLRLLFILKD